MCVYMYMHSYMMMMYVYYVNHVCHLAFDVRPSRIIVCQITQESWHQNSTDLQWSIGRLVTKLHVCSTMRGDGKCKQTRTKPSNAATLQRFATYPSSRDQSHGISLPYLQEISAFPTTQTINQAVAEWQNIAIEYHMPIWPTNTTYIVIHEGITNPIGQFLCIAPLTLGMAKHDSPLDERNLKHHHDHHRHRSQLLR